jgi:streptogramin lyase
VDATGTSARFNAPRGLTVDPSGNVYVTDTGNHTIRKITPAGVVTTIAGSALNPGYVNGSGVAARFNSPIGIVYVPTTAPNIGGMLLITDANNHAIRMLNPNTGMVTTYAGPLPSATNGIPTAGYVNSTRFGSRFNSPIGITVNPTTGVAYITDTNNHAIKMIIY